MQQIIVQPQAVGLCCFHKRIDDCTHFRSLGRIGKESPLPSDDKGSDGVFNLVVADFNLAISAAFHTAQIPECAVFRFVPRIDYFIIRE